MISGKYIHINFLLKLYLCFHLDIFKYYVYQPVNSKWKTKLFQSNMNFMKILGVGNIM